VAAASTTVTVTPFVDCLSLNLDGTYTVVFGYANRGDEAVTIPLGSMNKMYPSRFQGSQPTEFLPGTHHGAFSVRVSVLSLNSVSWALGVDSLLYAVADLAVLCSPSTPLPAHGNGTGLAVALVGGGAFGVFFVRRLIRRAAPTG
jgi:hypothetical protein